MKSRYAMGTVVCTALAGWGLLWAWGSASPVRQPVPAAATSGISPASLGFAGAGGCSARACHGGTEPVKDAVALQNEYSTFLAYDKHSRAYQALTEKRAWVMAENLAATNPGGKVIPPHLDQRCLACHTTPEAANQSDPDKADAQLSAFRAEGVSCEACHGPSKKEPKHWYSPHTAPENWRKKLSPAQKAASGFTDLSDLKLQAETCAGCHVGAPPDTKRNIPARDVNHDIMAAGHPRLNFELTVFRANMPPHWNVSLKEKNKPGPYEAKAWAVGQVVSARAALDLLLYRTKTVEKDRQSADASVRWPEFAEYRCFACHADLHPEWRDRSKPTGRVVGSLPYDPWYNSLLPAVFKAVPGSQTPDLAAGYRKLTVNMAQPENNLEAIDRDADALLKDLNGWLGEYSQKDYDPDKLLKAVLDSAGTPVTWEQSTQLTLAIAALKRGAIVAYLKKQAKDPAAKKPAELAALEEVVRGLAFAEDSESPSGLTGPFAAKAPLRKHLQALLDLLASPGR